MWWLMAQPRRLLGLHIGIYTPLLCIVPLLAFGSVATAQQEAPRVAFAPLHGPNGAHCAKNLFEEALDLGIDAVEWFGPPLPSAGGFKRIAGILTLVPFDVVIQGHVKDDRVVLQAYRTRPVRLLGLAQIRTAGRCGLTSKGREVLNNWWRHSVMIRSQGGEPYALGAVVTSNASGASADVSLE